MRASITDNSCAVVHVIEVDLDTYETEFGDLSSAEMARYRRFAFENDRRRYAAAHSALRHVLSRLTGIASRALRFHFGEHGKPALGPEPLDVRFNLSHSGRLGLIALAIGRDVGVDVEEIRDIEIPLLASLCFSPSEQAALRDFLDPKARLAAFYRCWTRKESFVKATGAGLSCPLKLFDVSLEEWPAQALLHSRLPQRASAHWTIVNVASAPGFAAAVTAQGAGWRARHWESPAMFIGSEDVSPSLSMVDNR